MTRSTRSGPHAYYFCYLPPEIQAMIPPPAMERGILQTPGDPLCRGLIWGEYFNGLSAPIRESARRDYHYSGCGRLFLRDE